MSWLPRCLFEIKAIYTEQIVYINQRTLY